MIQGYQFDKSKVTPESDAALYSYLGQGGLDNNVASGMTATASGLNIYVATGKALVQGRWVAIQQQEQLRAQANTSGYVVVTIDLTQSNTATGTPGKSDYEPVNNQLRLELVGQLNRQDLNNGGLIYTFPLYSYVSTGTSVTLTKYLQSFKIPDYVAINRSIGNFCEITLKRIGNVVSVTFRGQNTTQLNAGTTFTGSGGIPSGYRCVESESIVFLAQGRRLDTYFYFDPDGTIRYMGEAIPVSSFFRGTISYLTRDPWPI